MADTQYANPFAELDGSIKQYIDVKFEELKDTILQVASSTSQNAQFEQPKMINSKQTAEMLGMSWQTLKKHYIDTMKLKPINNNGKFFFNYAEVADLIKSKTSVTKTEESEPRITYNPRGKKH